MKGAVTAAALVIFGATTATAENPVKKNDFVGVMSGPAAEWSISNQRSMKTRAARINETGGYEIGGVKYDFAIVFFDDQKYAGSAIAGME